MGSEFQRIQRMCLVLKRAEQMAEFREESLVTRNGLGVLNFLTEV